MRRAYPTAREADQKPRPATVWPDSAGKDKFLGSGGSDTINAEDGNGGESVDCGSSLFDDDLANADPGDVVSNDCDRVKR